MNKNQIRKISHIIGYFPQGRKKEKYINAILTYHGVSDRIKKNCVPIDVFKEQIYFLKKNYNIVKLSELINFIKSGIQVEENFVSITFDDAYLNVYQNAYPLLKKLNIPATIFIPYGLINKHNTWDYNPSSDYELLKIMNKEQLLSLDTKLIDFGSHTYTHARLSRISSTDLITEIKQSKSLLEDMSDREITTISYPYGQLGDFNKETIRIVEESNYTAGLTTHFGRFNYKQDLLLLKRISVWDDDDVNDLKDKLEGFYDWIAIKEKMSPNRFLKK